MNETGYKMPPSQARPLAAAAAAQRSSRSLEAALARHVPGLVMALGAHGAQVRMRAGDAEEYQLLYAWPRELAAMSACGRMRARYTAQALRLLTSGATLSYARDPTTRHYADPNLDPLPFDAVRVLGLSTSAGLRGTLLLGFDRRDRVDAGLDQAARVYAGTIAELLEGYEEAIWTHHGVSGSPAGPPSHGSEPNEAGLGATGQSRQPGRHLERGVTRRHGSQIPAEPFDARLAPPSPVVAADAAAPAPGSQPPSPRPPEVAGLRRDSRQDSKEPPAGQPGQLQAIVEASEALGYAESRSDAGRLAVDTVLARTGASWSGVWLHRADAGVLELVASDGYCGDGGGAPGSAAEAAWRILEKGEAEYLPEGAVTSTRQHATAVLFGVPLRDAAGCPIGVLTARWSGPRAQPSNVEKMFLSAIAQACSHATARLALLENSARVADAYRALANFSASIEEINDIGELMTLGLQSLRAQLGMDMVTYHELRGGYCYPMELWGEYPRALIKVRNSRPKQVGEGLTGHVAASGEMVYVEDYRRWEGALKDYISVGLATQLVIPVKRRGEVVKIISLCCFNRIRPLDVEQLTIARNFVRRLENALERADNLSEVHATRESTMRALGLMLEHRDFETKGHTDRVAGMTLRLARRLELPQGGTEALRWGAYLHDIGKVALPDDILLKRARLDTGEMAVVKEHTLIGVEMCRDIPFLPDETRQIVRSHHERWDGDGYPDGLAGQDIPLGARLFSLIDVYDALTSDRPYKAAWSQEAALAEIRSNRGRQFDPELTDAFLAELKRDA